MPFPIPRARRTLLAGAAVAGGLALTAAQADAAYTPSIQDRTLVVTGDAASDKLALRVPANATKILELDVGDNGSADFRIPRLQFERIHVRAGDGADQVRVDSAASSVVMPPTTLEGEAGNDTLLGGSGAETLSAGDGTDTVDAGSGDDAIDLGPGNDLSIWQPGDGSDALAGGDGFDALSFSGSGADEELELTAAGGRGGRARLTRDVGTIAVDTDAIERVDVEPLGGDDTLAIGNLTGTRVQEVRADLEAVAGGGASDTGSDQIVVSGTSGDDWFSMIDAGAGTTDLVGPTFVSIQRSDPARDDLTINGLGGRDRIEASGPGSLHYVQNGGAGNDTLTGSDRVDELNGGDGDDVVVGRRGDDVVRLGAGNDLFRLSAGDGSDALEAQGGADTLSVSGTPASETFDVSADGSRVRLAREVAAGTEIHDARGVETVDLFSFGGADTFIVDDLTGTGVTAVNPSLFDFSVPGGANDVVVVNATGGDDTITVAAGTGAATRVTGLAAALAITGTAVAGDRLEINGLEGDDAVDSTALPASAMQFRGDGGPGNDVFTSGAGDDVVSGGTGADVLFAGSGDNVAFGGAGDDVLRGEEGDDVLDGGADDDILIGNAGDDVLLNGEIVFDE